MAIKNLYKYLSRITSSERKHILDGPKVLSKKYSKIPQTTINNKAVYQFEYNSILGPSNIAINKESRWTYIPNHVHTVIEMIYVFNGQCTQKINGKTIKMKRGDLCILDENVLHSIGYLKKDDLIISIEMRKKYFSEGILTQLAEDSIISAFIANAISETTQHNSYLLFRNINRSACQSINEILKEYFDKSLCSNQIINAHMVLLMCELMRQFQNIQHKTKNQSSLNIEEVLIYIEQNYKKTNLQETAAHFGFHPNYLSCLMKKKTGKNFKQLVLEKKFKNCLFLLISTSIPIYRIAEELGYNNLGFFYKKFETLYHMSPQEYRKKHQS